MFPKPEPDTDPSPDHDPIPNPDPTLTLIPTHNTSRGPLQSPRPSPKYLLNHNMRLSYLVVKVQAALEMVNEIATNPHAPGASGTPSSATSGGGGGRVEERHTVPSSLVGRIIGHSGDTIKKIREASGCKVTLVCACLTIPHLPLQSLHSMPFLTPCPPFLKLNPPSALSLLLRSPFILRYSCKTSLSRGLTSTNL